MPNVACAHCASRFYRSPSHIKNKNYCSKSCYDDFLESKLESMVGRKYNSLTVTGIVARTREDRFVTCECECGNNLIVRAIYLRNNHSKSCGYCTGSTSMERFITYTSKDESGCWLWTGTKNAGGYGMMSHQGRQSVSSRVSWELHHGEIPKGMFVCHTCDVRHCVNPDHLWLGNNQDNMTDMSEKQRNHRGEAHFRAKLTSESVIEIRKLHKQGLSPGEIAPFFNVVPQTIAAVLNGITWRHVS